MLNSVLLPASIAALATGPLIATLARTRPALFAFVDGFVLVTIGGLVLLDVVPHALANGDPWAALFMLLGFALPTLAERLFRVGVDRTHAVVLLLALVGIAIHSALDGSAIAQMDGTGRGLMGYGVLLHQLPVSMMVWLVMSDRARIWTWAVLAFMALATGVGYAVEPEMLAVLPARAGLWFEALVGGSLLHVVAHPAHDHDHHHDHAHSHAHDHSHDQVHAHDHEPANAGVTPGAPAPAHVPNTPSDRLPNGLGALAGIALLVLLHVTRSGAAELDVVSGVWHTFMGLALESAPALLVAYVAAGLVYAFVSPAHVSWLSRGSRLRQGLSGMAVGLPLPICSCGVVPLYEGLVRQGASTTAAIAFLVATPELGLDAVLLSLPLLGMEYTVVRVIAAALVALGVALVMGRLVAARPSRRALPVMESAAVSASNNRWKTAIKSGFADMVDHTAPWILVGLFIAALMAPVLEGSWITRLPTGVDVVLFALLGLPLYICASASTPLVAVLVAAGVSPGAGLALLITGPATNVATLGILSRMHGRTFALGFAMAMIVAAIAVGVVTNIALPALVLPSRAGALRETTSPIELAALVALVVLYAASIVRRGARGFLGELRFSQAT